MNGATYRIEIAPDPHSPSWPYSARITRLSDDLLVAIVPSDTAEQAEHNGRAWVAAETSRPASSTLYVGDDGQDARPL